MSSASPALQEKKSMLGTAYNAQGLMEVCKLICVVLVAWRMMTGGSPYMLC